MDKLIITAALTGSRPTKAMNPAVPYSPAEIAAEAVACARAGAAVVHIHVRDPLTGAPSSDPALFTEVVARIREACDVLINLTTSGLHIEGEDVVARRLAPVALRPELCSLDIGSVNFRDRLFANPPDWGETAARAMQEAGVKPEIEVFDVGHIHQARHLIERGLIDPPPYFQLCMGVDWGIPATAENLLFMQRQLPPGAVWSVLGVGRAQLPMITLGILLGGHIRVGFEDNLYLRKGVLAPSNAAFVEMAVHLAHQLQREVATPAEARALLGLRPAG
ncbi:MAG: 3-keto-5-aminohexanoate cleavage protein [Caldilineales bacterium]|nr:3-keto-5-aminohexanoate cleavage protein [Caldilineales bacterium]